jgi:hypothetical protein
MSILLQTKLEKDYCCVPMTYTARILEFRSVCLNFKKSYESGLFRCGLIFGTYAPMMCIYLDILSLWLLMHVS